jgi:hypothetical protein
VPSPALHERAARARSPPTSLPPTRRRARAVLRPEVWEERVRRANSGRLAQYRPTDELGDAQFSCQFIIPSDEVWPAALADLTTFKTHAISRLVAQNQEVERLREQAAGIGNIRCLPTVHPGTARTDHATGSSRGRLSRLRHRLRRATAISIGTARSSRLNRTATVPKAGLRMSLWDVNGVAVQRGCGSQNMREEYAQAPRPLIHFPI